MLHYQHNWSLYLKKTPVLELDVATTDLPARAERLYRRLESSPELFVRSEAHAGALVRRRDPETGAPRDFFFDPNEGVYHFNHQTRDKVHLNSLLEDWLLGCGGSHSLLSFFCPSERLVYRCSVSSGVATE